MFTVFINKDSLKCCLLLACSSTTIVINSSMTALRVHICTRRAIRASLPSATVPLASPLRVSGTLCRPTSRHRHHCLSSSDISKLSHLPVSKRDTVISYFISVKCSRSFFLTARHFKILFNNNNNNNNNNNGYGRTLAFSNLARPCKLHFPKLICKDEKSGIDWSFLREFVNQKDTFATHISIFSSRSRL